MMPIYTQKFTLNALHLDCFRRLKPSVLLYFVQEISGNHAAVLGTDWETLAKKNLFWALVRHQVEILRLPEAGETITLETWPMPTTRAAYPRATVARDSSGSILFRSTSLWVLMTLDTRAMVLPGKSGVEVPGSLRGCELKIPDSIPPKMLENAVQKTVGYTELDRNNHMNNTRYFDWVDDLLPAAFHREHPVRRFNIAYLSEAREGQTVCLTWEKSAENILSVEGRSAAEDARRIFAVTAEY